MIRLSRVSRRRKKFLLGDDAAALDELKNRLLLREEKIRDLSFPRLPEDYFIFPGDCPDCKDTGYIGNERCHCFKQAAIDLVYTQSNIRSILAEENFDHFSYDYYSDTQTEPVSGLSPLALIRRAREESEHFIDQFGAGRHVQNLFFLWQYRGWKDLFSNCIAKELLDADSP